MSVGQLCQKYQCFEVLCAMMKTVFWCFSDGGRIKKIKHQSTFLYSNHCESGADNIKLCLRKIAFALQKIL